MNYDNDLKRKMCIDVCVNGKSTIEVANEFSVPLKTFEKWITIFNKDPHYFDNSNQTNSIQFVSKSLNNPIVDNYNDLSNDELKKQLLKKDIELARLKKGYMVKGGGMAKKEFITFSKKNMK